MLCSTECTRVAEPCSPFAISLCSGLWLRLRLLVYCKSSIYNLFLQFVCLKKVLAILFSLDMKNILKKIIFLKNFAKFKAFLFYLCFIFWVEPDPVPFLNSRPRSSKKRPALLCFYLSTLYWIYSAKFKADFIISVVSSVQALGYGDMGMSMFQLYMVSFALVSYRR